MDTWAKVADEAITEVTMSMINGYISRYFGKQCKGTEKTCNVPKILKRRSFSTDTIIIK